MAKEFILQSDHLPRSLWLGGAYAQIENGCGSGCRSSSRGVSSVREHRHYRAVRRLRTQTVRQVGLVTMKSTHRAPVLLEKQMLKSTRVRISHHKPVPRSISGFPHGPLWRALVSAADFSISNHGVSASVKCICFFSADKQPLRVEVP